MEINIISELVKEIQEEIDSDILYNLLVSSGSWIEIELPDYPKEDLVGWLEYHFKTNSSYVIGSSKIAFKKQEDATLFILRWG